MAHDIIGKVSAEVRAARLGISAFPPYWWNVDFQGLGITLLRDFVLATYKSIPCNPQMAIRLSWFSGVHYHRYLTVKRLHYTLSDIRPSARVSEEWRGQLHSTCYKFIPLPNTFEVRRTELVNETSHRAHDWDTLRFLSHEQSSNKQISHFGWKLISTTSNTFDMKQIFRRNKVCQFG